MKDLKKTLKIAGWISLATCLLGVASLLMDIFVYVFDLYYIISDSFEIILSIVTGTLYLVYARKDDNKIINKRNLFLVFSIVNIFNNLIVWIVSFWVEISVNNAFKKQTFYNFSNGYRNQQNNQNGNTQPNKNEFVMNESDYTVRDSANIEDKLARINKLKEDNMISEEEYNDLKNKIFDELVK